ncbi:MAG: uroporphyrinogen decarboxylase [Puniceicoccaceae bacterium]|nr:MAG: uroporphyrinogen decarboxylase [Puniceicoccaceae bacterium]
MTSRDRFLAALDCRPLDRPPVWIMRQAGRYLPEYRALKERHSFTELVRTPELAAEVTLQPLKRFPLDAAIVFSDILVIPEALGQPYSFRDGGGIEMDFALDCPGDFDRLEPAGVSDRLGYVGEALRRIRRTIGQDKALLGFAGSPWTLACYMVEGGSSKDFQRIKALFYGNRPAFDRLLGLLADTVASYLQLQYEAGADAVQIFDSWGGAIAGTDYEAASLQWIRRILESLPADLPVILYSRAAASLDALAACRPRALGLDYTLDLAAAVRRLPPGLAFQGNLDPALMEADPAIITRETRRLLTALDGRPGHILNLGHGITPRARIAAVEALLAAAGAP